MTFTVYILESQSNEKWYYGFTEDLVQRLSDHNTNRSKFTRFKGPWTLIFKREFTDKTQALQFEIYLKKMRNKTFIKSEYATFFLHQLAPPD
jgi:putative endonuclease